MNSYNVIRILQNGTTRQNKAYKAIVDSRIMEKLRDFNPFIAGTIPLNIYIEESDIDILCCSSDLNNFSNTCMNIFSSMEQYSLRKKNISGTSTVICSFTFQQEIFEIFCQNIPVQNQCGYRHFVAEWNLLSLGGDMARNEIRNLKKKGIKTEPAFGKYFSIPGDPYDSLYKLYELDLKNLKRKVEIGLK